MPPTALAMTATMLKYDSQLYSLTISPNLEKALEHEEQMGRRWGQRTISESSMSRGLPPPPRGQRKGEMSTAAAVERRRMLLLQATRSREEKKCSEDEMVKGRNPFVNRAPLLVPRAHRRSASMSSTSTDGVSSESLRPASTAEDSHRYSISSTVHIPSSEGHDNTYSFSQRDSFIDFGPLSSFPLPPPLPPKQPPTQRSKPRSAAPRPPPHMPPPLLPIRKSSLSRETVPPTTNFLNQDERADLVRKSRKLAQVFGTTPGAQHLQDLPLANHAVSNKLGLVRPVQEIQGEQSHWPPSENPQFLMASGRRHSAPLTPDDFSFINGHVRSTTDTTSNSPTTPVVTTTNNTRSSRRAGSPTSFIDLSDEDDYEFISTPVVTPTADVVQPQIKRRKSRTLSFDSAISTERTPQELLEDERRRKREKLARLHRFLGSRVPTNLVLGLDLTEEPELPPASPPPQDMSPRTEAERPVWLRRRRSSSIAAMPSGWSDDTDRVQENLNEEEKALNVRRAQKMEKMFGVAPPQKLYHTRLSPHTPTVSSDLSSSSGQALRQRQRPDILTNASSLGNRQKDNIPKSKDKRRDYGHKRPGTSESIQYLIPSGARQSADLAPPNTDVYYHYQHSLTQLNDIIDRADTQSLVELEEYLNNDQVHTSSPPLKEFVRSPTDRRMSIASSVRSERRHSLPASIKTITEDPLHSPTHGPEISEFQLRRRKAAKLTKFFGEDYMILISKVLGSIEQGLEEERKRGTLNADQTNDLLQKLRSLRSKRDRSY